MSRERPALNRAGMIATALRLLDQVGLDGLTLRGLAKELEVQPAALYWHVEGKQELLNQMAAAIVEDALRGLDRPRPGQSWDGWLTERARTLRVAILARRDGARLVAGARHIIDRRPTAETMLHSLTAAGFTPPQALQALRAFSHYLFGAILDEQATAAAPPLTAEDRFDDVPYLQAALADRGADHLERQFEYGLSCMLFGIRSGLVTD
ncbi:TetR/AcrR family transcriptional regulator C-terminal domain-containing protein [Nocardia sp. NPDC052112]|uniref:TetR/AcrR family transcriptional regulator C-terminal domain-containing protein n=1 Tax=Nocardia sp. NPDC052112 TaxID=3155646 RepID=UPI00341AA5C7